MKKIRLIRTIIIEYVPNVEHYPGCTTIEQMAEVDLQGANDDPELTFGDNPGLVIDEIKYEIVE